MYASTLERDHLEWVEGRKVVQMDHYRTGLSLKSAHTEPNGPGESMWLHFPKTNIPIILIPTVTLTTAEMYKEIMMQ